MWPWSATRRRTRTPRAAGRASGAFAVLGAFLYLFPKARVTSLFPFLFFLPLRFPAWIVLFWFALQWAAAQGADAGPGVAYLAHVAASAAGFPRVGGLRASG
ncbi:hypothetical protein SCALM49S_04606 [Streptomyces californicus]